MKSPIKWAGGKAALAPILAPLLPADVAARRWVEPFCGGAAMFWSLQPKAALLADANRYLVNFYRHLRATSPDRFLEVLQSRARSYSDFFYYSCRDRLTTFRGSLDDAADFWVLNKTGYNGLWRENQSGRMNTPWGKRKSMPLPTLEELVAWASRLRDVKLERQGYTETMAACTPADFVFIDPPYDGGFVAYTGRGFDAAEQRALAHWVYLLSSRGVPVILTNSDTPLVREIYRGFQFREIEAPRRIAANGDRAPARELVVTNYTEAGRAVA